MEWAKPLNTRGINEMTIAISHVVILKLINQYNYISKRHYRSKNEMRCFFFFVK